MVKLQKTNGSSAPAAALESVYAEGYAPAADVVAALDRVVETGEAVEMSEGRIARRAAVAEAAVHGLRGGAEVVYANRGRDNWHSIMRLDNKLVGSVEFVFGRAFHGELSARTYAALEIAFGRPGAGSHLHGPFLRPGETCEPLSVDAATMTDSNGTVIAWVRHKGLWFSAWKRSKRPAREGYVDAAAPTPGPGQAFPRIAIS